MVIAGQNNPGGSVIIVEPVRETPHASKEEVEKAVRNDGVALRGWMAQAVAWIIAQLAKIAFSVAIYRVVHQLFREGLASERVYRASPDLWTHGHPQESTGGGENGARPEGYAPLWSIRSLPVASRKGARWIPGARIEFVSLHEAIDTSTPMGRAMFHIAGAFAELEREIIRERVKAGLQNAHRRGRRLGRRRASSTSKKCPDGFSRLFRPSDSKGCGCLGGNGAAHLAIKRRKLLELRTGRMRRSRGAPVGSQ